MTTSNTYSYTYSSYYTSDTDRQNYVPETLPSWIHIEIEQEGNTKTVFVCSKIHVNKRVKLTPTYSSEFSDTEILKEISHQVSHKFL